MKIPLQGLLALFMAMALTGQGAERITVTKSGSVKSAIDWSGLNAGADPASRTFLTTLSADLVRSGWFEQGAPGRSQYVLQGRTGPGGRGLSADCFLYRAGTSQPLISQNFTESTEKARRLAHYVADLIVKEVTGTRGIASTQLVLVGNQTGRKELYICDADGFGLRPITQDRSISVAPKWDRQGARLLYTSYLNRYPDVYMIDVASGSRSRVARFPGLNTGGVFSPDGRQIALILSKDGNPELYVMDASGGNPVRLTRTPRAAEASPSWSPDGSKIAFVSDRSGKPQLYVISRNGGQETRLTSRGTENVSPDWGPNNLIAYSSRQGGRYQVMVMDPSSRQEKPVAQDYADYEDPSWAPDGRHISATRTVNHRSQVYILDTLGDAPVALTSQRGDWYSPAWSPR